MTDTNNGMMCDLESGVCGTPGEDSIQLIDLKQDKKTVTLYYATDPICSHCWALEPVLTRFLYEYGHRMNVQPIMGGLLASWHGFADRANGIQKPSDVEAHWKEVGVHSRMPIDGSLWRDNPVLSSYPPSRVYKVIERDHHKDKAMAFLRKAREAVFAFNRNIGEAEVLVDIVNTMGLDGQRIFEQSEQEDAQQLLQQDFELAASLGVRGFPTIIMVNEEGKGVKIVGARPYENYVDGLKQLIDSPVQPKKLPSLRQWLNEQELLFSKEMEVMYDLDKDHVMSFIQAELDEGSYQTQTLLGELYVQQKE